MPQAFVTKNQRRGHEFVRAVQNYIFESGETKTSLRGMGAKRSETISPVPESDPQRAERKSDQSEKSG